MTYKNIIISLSITFFLMAATNVYAQNAPTKEERTQVQEIAKEKAIRDDIRLEAAKDLKAKTEADAKLAEANANEAKLIDKEAAYAAKQAKRAAKMEAKAQRARADADTQAKKAAKAVKKSNNK